MEKVWRLILDEAREPKLNMAIDEAIMFYQAEAKGGYAPPTLRIYKWRYPCASIGRFQKPSIAFSSQKSGEDSGRIVVVRRPTGGGLVFHNEDSFTYSIICREDSGAVPKGALNSYREIHLGISRTLQSFGLEAELYTPCAGERRSYLAGACFNCPVKFDIVSGDRKIAGAAQRRKLGAILHQGEISLGLDVWSKWPYNNFVEVFKESLSERLKAVFIDGQILDKEKELAEKLATQMEEVSG